ncbi:hypothetical protein JCM11641_003083 [Rhodosporidiobolus odoratus]
MSAIKTLKLDWAAQEEPAGQAPPVALARNDDRFVLVWAQQAERHRRGGAWATDLSVLAEADPFPGFSMGGNQMVWVKTYSENNGLLVQMEQAAWLRPVGSALKQGITTLPLAEVMLSEAEVAQRCAMCDEYESVETATRFKRCSGCKRRYYHQHQHWPAHKSDCKLLAKGCFAEVEQRRRDGSYNPKIAEIAGCFDPFEPTRVAMSYNIKLDTPVQCETQSITWAGDPNVTKGLALWVQNTNYFAERIANNLTGALGTLQWECDVPAGAFIAFEVYNLPNATSYASTPFFQVQPGSTDACLRQNEGQLAETSMSSLAASLSSASPQLFTYPATTTNSPSSTSAPSTTSSISSQPPPASSTAASSSSGGANAGAIAGGVVGGVALLAFLGGLIWFFRRRSKNSRGGSSPSINEKGAHGSPNAGEETAATAGGAGGFFRSRSSNPVDTWRNRVENNRPPSAWTRRSRGFSFGTSAPAPGDSASAGPLSPPFNAQPPQLAGAANPFGTPSAHSAAPPSSLPSQGPRVGVPEVGEGGDYRPYAQSTNGPSAPYSSVTSRSQFGELADPSSFERSVGRGGGGGAPSSAYASPPMPTSTSAGLLAEGSQGVGSSQGMMRPPTRLTTPGGLTSYGGDDVGGGETSYASYAR